MKMGVKEFRERFSEVAEGGEPVFVTKNGRVVGKYDPISTARFDNARWQTLEAKLAGFREEWKARTPDWRERLSAAGFDQGGDSGG